MRWLAPNFFGSEAQHTYFDLFTLRSEPVLTASGYTFWDNAERWKQIDELFDAVLDLPETEREAYLSAKTRNAF